MLIYVSLMVFIFGCAGVAQADADTQLTPPPILDIDDPFSRDLKRAADDATGGIAFDDSAIGLETEEESGRALLGKEGRLSLTTARFRVMGVAVNNTQNSNAIFIQPHNITAPGTKPVMSYLRIGTHSSTDEAMQQAINLKASIAEYLDAALIIREAPHSNLSEGGDLSAAVDLDIGPFRTITHAERYCDMLITVTDGIVPNCYAVQEFPGTEPLNSFQSFAMIRFATDTVASIIQDDTVFDLAAASNQAFSIGEGEQLGSGSAILVKVLPFGVVAVDASGKTHVLPLAFIPEDGFKAEGDGLDAEIIIDSAVLETVLEGAEGGEANSQEQPRTAADILLNTGEDTQ